MSAGTTAVISALSRARVLAILRRPDVDEVATRLYDQLYAAGIRAIEVTLDQERSMAALEALVEHAGDDVLVGAGTVTKREQLDAVAGTGASFVVCPHFDPRLVEHAVDIGLPILPGVATGTEVMAALDAGASAVKLFPAGPLGIGYLEALRGPFRHVPIVPTGGIGVAEVPDWLDAGAVCVGIGSALFGPDGMDPALDGVLHP